MSVTCRDNAHLSYSCDDLKLGKVGQVDLDCGFWSGFISRSVLCMQDNKSLCAEVTICSTLVNIQTDTWQAQPTVPKIRQHTVALYMHDRWPL